MRLLAARLAAFVSSRTLLPFSRAVCAPCRSYLPFVLTCTTHFSFRARLCVALLSFRRRRRESIVDRPEDRGKLGSSHCVLLWNELSSMLDRRSECRELNRRTRVRSLSRSSSPWTEADRGTPRRWPEVENDETSSLRSAQRSEIRQPIGTIARAS